MTWFAPQRPRNTGSALRILAAAVPLYFDDALEAIEPAWLPKADHLPDFEPLVASLV